MTDVRSLYSRSSLEGQDISRRLVEGLGSSQKEGGSCLFLIGTWSGFSPSAPISREHAFPAVFSSNVAMTFSLSPLLCVARLILSTNPFLRSTFLLEWHRGSLEYFWEKRFSCFCKYFLWSTDLRQGADLSKAALMSQEAKLTKFSKVLTSLSDAMACTRPDFHESRKE